MKNLIYLLLTLLFSIFCNRVFCQDFILNEDFNNNNNKWDISHSGEAITKIVKGKYIANIKSGIYWLDRLIPVEIDESRDWVFESSMVKKSGNVSFGLTWGGDNGGGRYNFVIDNDKTYMIHKWNAYNVSFYVSSVFSNAIQKDGKSNKLTIKKTGKTIQFYVNDVYLTHIQAEPFFGKYFGFYANSGALKIEVDYIRLYYANEISANHANDFVDTLAVVDSVLKINVDSSKVASFVDTSLKVVLNDSFVNNNNKWPEINSIEGYTKVSDGKYLFENKQPFDPFRISIPVELSENQNYLIETTIKKTGGIDNNGFGVNWGFRDNDNKIEFTITSNGYYALRKYSQGETEDIIPYTESSLINKGNNSVNILKVLREGDQLFLYINQQKVNSVSPPSFTGNNIGFSIYKNQSVEIKKIRVMAGGENETTEHPMIEEIQDRSQLNSEEAFVYDFLAVWRDHSDDDKALMDFISPSWLKKKKLKADDYKVNLYFPHGFKITGYNKSSAKVTALIWGENKGWEHRLYFKVVKEHKKLYLYPSKFTESKYIYPWIDVEQYVTEDKEE